ncbi:MAG: type II toxin-antitoxin system RelE/ParE family toxin [Planctomycetales bacterium]|nr:type II toxin-antitoxin system RelE/ParE family toxin [Planctomycetales bacterium]
MPETELRYFALEDGTAPVLRYLEELAVKDRRAAIKCAARIEVLSELGHELRRPLADYLRDGIYELRIRVGNVNYRILYFFHGQNVVVLAHALTKKKEVPDIDIERALERKELYEGDPERHTFAVDSEDE